MTWIAHNISSANALSEDTIVNRTEGLDINGIEWSDTHFTLYYQDESLTSRIIDIFLPEIHRDMHRVKKIKDQNWNTTWESEYDPVEVDDFCIIHASFHEVKKARYEHSIQIDPKMSFGTGHHETTRMMIQVLRQTQVASRSVLDFGSGTGVLAILAHQLNASSIKGIEIHDIAVENMIENGRLNHVDVEWVHGDHLLNESSQSWDIVLANILRSVILDHLTDIMRIVRPHGSVLFSGYHMNEKHLIEVACAAYGWQPTMTLQDGLWCCQRFERKV